MSIFTSNLRALLQRGFSTPPTGDQNLPGTLSGWRHRRPTHGSAWGDGEKRIEKVLRRKRAQLRGAPGPVLV